jgi:hypothetical protein
MQTHDTLHNDAQIAVSAQRPKNQILADTSEEHERSFRVKKSDPIGFEAGEN